MALVSNCITLTPGTITLDVAEGDDGKNYHRQSNGNVYSADASKIPNLSKCRERAKEGIWKIEIKMKEVTMPELSKGNGLKK